jgi:hypothetical protein
VGEVVEVVAVDIPEGVAAMIIADNPVAVDLMEIQEVESRWEEVTAEMNQDRAVLVIPVMAIRVTLATRVILVLALTGHKVVDAVQDPEEDLQEKMIVVMEAQNLQEAHH